jgi:hypothetical protein
MKAQILTEDQIPEALSIARGVFDYCLRARITDLEMIHIFLQYTENTNIRNMIAEGTLTMWGIFEQGHMIAMSGMQKYMNHFQICDPCTQTIIKDPPRNTECFRNLIFR